MKKQNPHVQALLAVAAASLTFGVSAAIDAEACEGHKDGKSGAEGKAGCGGKGGCGGHDDKKDEKKAPKKDDKKPDAPK